MKRSILFCINSLQIGGAEQLLVDKINNWPVNDDIHLVLFSKENILISNINREIKIKEISDCSTLKMILLLRRYLLKNRINYVISHLEKPNKISLFSRFMTPTIVVPVIHNINIYQKKNLNYLIAKLIYRYLPNRVVAISGSVYKYLVYDIGLKKQKVLLIPNGIDFHRTKFNNYIIQLPKIREFFTLGRMVEAKGYDFLIKALAVDSIKNKNWKLTMIGEGNMKTEIEILISKHKLSRKIILLGSKKNPFNYIKPGSICLMPSRREGLPIALLEVLSNSIPVLSSNIESLNLVKDNFNGFKFKSEKLASLEDVFKKAVQIEFNEYERLSKNALISIKGYDIHTCIDSYSKLLE